MSDQKVKLGNLDLTLAAAQAKSDPRFPLFQHLYDVHHWDIAEAFTLCNSQLGQDSIRDNVCPLKGCGKALASLITLTDA
jgi:hypothetical protein